MRVSKAGLSGLAWAVRCGPAHAGARMRRRDRNGRWTLRSGIDAKAQK